MMWNRKWKYTVYLIFSMALFSACIENSENLIQKEKKLSENPESLARQAKNVGVYVQADNSVTELAVFGVQTSSMFFVEFSFNEPIPKARSVLYFLVNIPNANISESKLFWLTDITQARWNQDSNDPRNPKPVKATIEPLTATIYKVSPANPESMVGKGFVCLWLRTQLGTPDRLYAVEVGDSYSTFVSCLP